MKRLDFVFIVLRLEPIKVWTVAEPGRKKLPAGF